MSDPTPSLRDREAESGSRGQRARARAHERGATLFLVVLVISVITAIGVFAMRSASLVDVATGYNRQSVQAAFLAEYSARAAATLLGQDPSLLDSPAGTCQAAYVAATPGAKCGVIKTEKLEDHFSGTAPSGLVGPLSGALSVTNSSTTIQAELPTEYLEATSAPRLAAGFAVDSDAFKSVVLTSRAQVYPTDDTAVFVCAPGSKEALSQQAVRAHVIVPRF